MKQNLSHYKNTKHKKKQPKPKIVRTLNYMHAYVINSNGSSNNLPSYASVINHRMLSIWKMRGEGKRQWWRHKF